MVRMITGVIWLYQNTFSRLMPATCRFYPSCSQYQKEALEKYGLFKGLSLGIRRLLKCHPFHSGGYDPVR